VDVAAEIRAELGRSPRVEDLADVAPMISSRPPGP
jgi:hypothetical protein